MNSIKTVDVSGKGISVNYDAYCGDDHGFGVFLEEWEGLGMQGQQELLKCLGSPGVLTRSDLSKYVILQKQRPPTV